MPLSSRTMDNCPKIDSTHQDKNDEMDTVGLYSHKKYVLCQCSTIPRDIDITWKPYY